MVIIKRYLEYDYVECDWRLTNSISFSITNSIIQKTNKLNRNIEKNSLFIINDNLYKISQIIVLFV